MFTACWKQVVCADPTRRGRRQALPHIRSYPHMYEGQYLRTRFWYASDFSRLKVDCRGDKLSASIYFKESDSWLITTTHESHISFQTFRQSCRSELSSGRGVLISPPGPLIVQRRLILSAAVRRVCLEVWFPQAFFPLTWPTTTFSRRSNNLHRRISLSVAINSGLRLRETSVTPET